MKTCTEAPWHTRWKEFRRKWLLRVLPPFLHTWMRSLFCLLTIQINTSEKLHAICEHDGPVLFAFWHGRMLLMPYIVHKFFMGTKQVWILISRHWNGEVIANTVSTFGISTIRGSSTRGGGDAFLKMIRVAKKGTILAIAPDGPRGPRYRAQAGIINLARLTGAPIVPIAFSARPRWIVPSWDRLLVPFPCGRALFVIGDPLWVPAKISEHEEKNYQIQLGESLNRITRRADEIVEETQLMDFFYVLYNLLLLPVSVIVLPYMVIKILTTARIRKGLRERFGIIPRHRLPSASSQRPLWVHAVSVGEVTATVPFLKTVRNRYPNLPIVVSTITATGQDTARRHIPEADAVIYFPFDYPWIVIRSLRAIRPRLFVHTETEIWPNFLFVLRRMGIPSVIVNGRISEASCRRYCWFRFFFRRVLAPIEIFGMQSQMDCVRVIRIGADPRKVLVTGNMKFDHPGATIDPEGIVRLKASMGFSETSRIFVAGSTHAGEEEIIISVYSRLRNEFDDLKLVIAPRHPERFRDVGRLVGARGYRVAKRTQLLTTPPRGEKDIVILDTIGELGRVYAIGTIVFVGGSLINIGGHNLLEPIAYKKATLFGPYMDNAAEIAEALTHAGGGVQVSNGDMLYQEARRLLRDPKGRERIGEVAFGILKEHQGATEKNLSVLRTFLDS